ncbi:MAG: hypothetical protein K0Q55_2019 [Verrucomicrobia bacterium]|jgi:hypothetical protein|nr:hypothetical protein [Verrucomicrobiota bacterium]
MEWYYAKDKVQKGPVDQKQLRALLATGEIDASTLIWRDGMADWQPFGKAMPTMVPPKLPDGQSGHACSRCGKIHLEGDLIKFEGHLICSLCKPFVFQQFKETGRIVFGSLWRSGKILVMTPDADLPDFCVKCNAPATGQRLKRNLFWHNPLLYLLILINLIIYAIAASLSGKKASIHIGLCDRHRKNRWIAMACGWGSFALGILIIAVSGSMESWVMFFLGLTVLLVGIIAGVSLSAVVSAKKITAGHLFVKGVCPEYLARLPEWTGGE